MTWANLRTLGYVAAFLLLGAVITALYGAFRTELEASSYIGFIGGVVLGAVMVAFLLIAGGPVCSQPANYDGQTCPPIRSVVDPVHRPRCAWSQIDAPGVRRSRTACVAEAQGCRHVPRRPGCGSSGW